MRTPRRKDERPEVHRIEQTTAVPPPPAPSSGRIQRPRHLQVAACLAATAWYFCAAALADSAANGISIRVGLGPWQPVLQGLFAVFLVVVGIALLAGIERRRAPLRVLLGLPLRATARKEWAEGAALGWGVAVLSLVIMLAAGIPQIVLWSAPRSWEVAVLNLVALCLLSLALALGIFGYGFQRLIDATGPARATLLMCLGGGIYAAVSGVLGQLSGGRVLLAVVAMLVLCVCWTRTHAVWLLWGLSFAWVAATGVLFGLPLAGSTIFASVIQMEPRGPVWLNGGDFGPAESLPLLLLLVAALPVLFRMTSDYAWEYTRLPLIPAGYPVDIPPPAAHSASETPAPPPMPVLVQILPSTPQVTPSEYPPK